MLIFTIIITHINNITFSHFPNETKETCNKGNHDLGGMAGVQTGPFLVCLIAGPSLHCPSWHRFILSSFCRCIMALPMAHTMVGTLACTHSIAPSHWVQSLMDAPSLMVIWGIRNLQKGRIAYAAPMMVGPLRSSRSIKSPFKTSQQVCAQHCMFIVVIIIIISLHTKKITLPWDDQ
jgi:hypothetical protein